MIMIVKYNNYHYYYDKNYHIYKYNNNNVTTNNNIEKRQFEYNGYLRPLYNSNIHKRRHHFHLFYHSSHKYMMVNEEK